MNCIPLRNLAACSLLVAVGGAFDAAADEILIYKVSAARRWQQDEAFFPNRTTPPPVLRNSNAGSFTDTSYLVLNRTSGEATTVDYYTAVRDGGKFKEYLISRDRFELWGPNFPANALWEYQTVAGTGTNVAAISLKQGANSDFSGDVNGDGQADATREGNLSFLLGSGGARVFGKGANAVTVQQVPAKLTGVKREGRQVSYGPLENPQTYGFFYYRGSGNQTATLDTKLTESALNYVSASLTGVTSVNTTNVFVKTAHGLETGDELKFESGTDFPELTPGTVYHVIRVNSSQFRLALTPADAKGGVFIDLTVNGTVGVFTPGATIGAVALVQAALEKLGYDNVTPPTPLLP
jgi:hypothetical protein